MKLQWKKKLSIVVVVAMMMTTVIGGTGFDGVCQVQAAQEVQFVDMDMSRPFTYGGGSVSGCTYDANSKSLTVTNVEQFLLKLPTEVNTGEDVTVHLVGTCDSKGFRSWLSDDSIGNNSNIMKTTELDSFSNEAFDITYVLGANTFSNSICIKGISYGTNIASMTLTTFEVYVKKEEGKVYKTPDPYTPDEAQAINANPLSLTKGNVFTANGETVYVDSLLVSQRFIADPTCIEYNGRLYMYGTTDEIEFDGKGNVVDDAYNTHTLSCLSTSDLVNWKDEGKIDVKKLTNYAQKSWAPTITSKEVNGKTKFFLYYTTGGDGIAMLTADSPTGPWTDPLGKRIIDRSVPTCSESEVPWLFDPGVFTDDDGVSYIYFGGNAVSDSGKNAARICKLSDDMTSLAETPHAFQPYYYFEDNEINKIGDTYYYSYSTNWSSDLSNGKDKYTGQACIAYYTADNPYMENATYHGTVFANPGSLYGNSYNNHHHMFSFKNKWYIAYHTTYLEQSLYGTKKGYRCLHVDKLNIDGTTLSATPTYEGVESVGVLDGTEKTDATTMARSAGVTTSYSESQSKMVLSKIDTGDWVGVKNVNFDSKKVAALNITAAAEQDGGSVEVYLDSLEGTKLATVPISATGGMDAFKTMGAATGSVSGTHDVYFVFRSNGMSLASWEFSTEVQKAEEPVVTPVPVNGGNSSVTKPVSKTIQGVSYQVSDGKTAEVTSVNKKSTKIVIPDTVKIQGKKYPVSVVRSKAFAKSKKVKEVVLGKNVKTIKAKAFYKKSTIRKITCKGTKIRSIGNNAFKGIYKKAVIKVPKSAKKKMKKLLTKKTGFTKKMKLK